MKGRIFESVQMSAKVIRKDGTVEDLGVISKSKRSIIERLKGVIRKWQQ